MKIKILFLLIFFSQNLKAQYEFKGLKQSSPKDEGVNFLVDDIVLLGTDDSFIFKSTAAGRIAWYKNIYIKNVYQADYGLYNTTHNDKYYVSTSGNFQKGGIELFDLNSGTLLDSIKNKNHTAFKAVCFNKSGNLIYAVDDWGFLQILDLAKMKITFKKKISNIDTWSINISNNDSVLYIGTARSIILYSIFSKKVVKEIKGFHSEVTSLIFSSHGDYFATISNFDTIQVFNNDGNLFRKICTNDTSIYSITFDPGGNIIYFSPNGQIVEYCNYKQGNSIDTVKGDITSFMDSKNDKVLYISYPNPNPLNGDENLYLTTLDGYLFEYWFCRKWSDCHVVTK